MAINEKSASKIYVMKYLFVFAVTQFLLIFKVGAQIANENNIALPEVGKQFQGFQLHDKKNAAFFSDTLTKFKGKYLILDFFSSGCAGCFISFPHIRDFQKEFSDNLQIIIFGLEDKHIRKQYDSYRRKLQLTNPVVFDSAFVNYAVPFGYPHLIWIDTSGIVKAITHARDLTKDNLTKFLKGEKFDCEDRSHAAYNKYQAAYEQLTQNTFDWFLTKDSTGQTIVKSDIDTNYFLKTEIGKWKTGMSWDPPRILTSGPNADHAITGSGSLDMLYRFAFVGEGLWNTYSDLLTKEKYRLDTTDIYYKIFPKIEIGQEDSTLFFGEYPNEKNLYWYRLIMSTTDTDKESLLQQMQEDLEKTFGFSARFIRKEVNCFYLVKSNGTEQKLKTKGGTSKMERSTMEIHLRNTPFIVFSNLILRNYLASRKNREVYFDATGLTCNIDIDLTGALYERSEVRKLLKEYGLDIVPGKKEMYVLKIKRAKQIAVETLIGSTRK